MNKLYTQKQILWLLKILWGQQTSYKQRNRYELWPKSYGEGQANNNHKNKITCDGLDLWGRPSKQ